jgi:tellurite resistance protein
MKRSESSTFLLALAICCAASGNVWRLTTRLWEAPSVVGEILHGASCVFLLAFVGSYIKELKASALSIVEARATTRLLADISPLPAAILFLAVGIFPYSQTSAEALVLIGFLCNVGYFISEWPSHLRQSVGETKYVPKSIPLAASIFLNAFAAGAIGYVSRGWILFALGVACWLLFESKAAKKVMNFPTQIVSLKIARSFSLPPVTGLFAYQTLSDGRGLLSVTIALAAYALFVYGGLLYLRFRTNGAPASTSDWVFSIGAILFAHSLLLLRSRSDNGIVDAFIGCIFGAGIYAIAYLAIKQPSDRSVPN